MPDWTIHLGASSLLSRKISPQAPWLLLLGGILPDLVARLDSIMLDILHIGQLPYYSFACFHTPFMMMLLSGWIALVYPSHSKREMMGNFRFLFLGSLLHFLMDMLEVKVPGFGEYLLFPFSGRFFQINLINEHGFWYLALYVSMLITLIKWLLDLKKSREVLPLPGIKAWVRSWKKQSRKRIWKFLTIAILLIPVYGRSFYKKHDAGYIRFLQHQEKWEGKKVGLYVSEVVSVNPTILYEHPWKIRIVTDHPLKAGEWISVYGLYRNGRIEVSRLNHEWGAKNKGLFSLVGLLIVVIGLLRTWTAGKSEFLSDYPAVELAEEPERVK